MKNGMGVHMGLAINGIVSIVGEWSDYVAEDL